MNDYTPNSHKFREAQKQEAEKKKVEKVTTGIVKTKKKSEISKFTDIFVAEDMRTVKDYLVQDILIPAAKKLIDSVVSDGIHMLLYGDARRGKNGSSNASRVSYGSFYENRDRASSNDNARTRNGYNYDDIVVETRGEAEEVLDRMDELVETYGHVSVADLYDLVGKTCQYTDNNYGWTNVRNAEPIRVRDGYLLKFPKVTPLKR